jgi:GT2 family glycosyltransferase
MRVVALVLSVDEAPRLEASLPVAVAQSSEVVVIDDACADDTAAVAERHGARVVRLPARLSYAAAMNAGLAEVLGGEADAVLLLNADCVLDDGFVAAAAARLAEPGIGAVAPLVLRASGMRPEDRLDEVDAAGMWLDRRRKNGLVGHGEPPARHAAPGEVFGGDGACVLYRAEVLRALAPEVVDEDMALWATDADLAWRVRAAGWRCAYEPRARAWHVRFYSPSTRAGLPAEHRRLQFRNRLLMLVKNERGWRNLPHVAGYEVLALGYALLRERELLRGYAEAARLAPRMWRKRQASRSSS